MWSFLPSGSVCTLPLCWAPVSTPFSLILWCTPCRLNSLGNRTDMEGCIHMALSRYDKLFDSALHIWHKHFRQSSYKGCQNHFNGYIAFPEGRFRYSFRHFSGIRHMVKSLYLVLAKNWHLNVYSFLMCSAYFLFHLVFCLDRPVSF